MDQPTTTQENVPVPPAQAAALPLCPGCHFVVKPEYYYCPNCGAKLSEAPLATDALTQVLLYAFSLILPWIAYLAITKWQGIKYFRSPDDKARQVGMVMIALLTVSSVIAFWLTYVWIQGTIQQSMNDLNSNFGGL